MASTLNVAPGLRLGLDFVTKTAAILAQRRKGKTYTASVLAEELVAVRQPFVALDPTGAWWGMRAAANGSDPGLPVVILGGPHGDIPIDRTDGRAVAELVVDQPGYFIIDFSLFESGGAERQFATDFAERLYRRKAQPDSDFPMHLFVDEADRFIPQRVSGGKGDARESDQRLLGAFEAIVRRGGLRGLGTSLISQRAAVVNKNVLEQVDLLIILRTVGPNDRKAVDGYISAHGTDEERSALLGSLASLSLGQAWFWEPGAEPPLFRRVQIRERHTFNSSATPKPGEHRAEPRQLTPVDLDVIKEQMASSIERSQQDDPVFLRKRIRELERAKQPAAAPAPPEKVYVPAWSADELAELRRFGDAMTDVVQGLVGALTTFSSGIEEAARALRAQPPQAVLKEASVRVTPLDQQGEPSGPTVPVRGVVRMAGEGRGGLSGRERKILTALAQHGPLGLRRIQAHTGFSSQTSTVSAGLSILRKAGLVTEGFPTQITPEGLEALGSFERLPTGADLLNYWMGQLGERERQILGHLVNAWPSASSHQAMCDLTGYSPQTSTVSAGTSRLRKLGLVGSGYQLHPDFAAAIGL